MDTPHPITRQMLAATAANRWELQHYRRNPVSPSPVSFLRKYQTAPSDWSSDKARDIHAALVALGANPDPVQVEQIIGNKFWTTIPCSRCGRDVELVIVVAETAEEDDIKLCAQCIAAVARALLVAEKAVR